MSPTNFIYDQVSWLIFLVDALNKLKAMICRSITFFICFSEVILFVTFDSSVLKISA